MTQNEDGPAIDRGGASGPAEENRDRDQAGETGKTEAKGTKPSPGARAEGETSAAAAAAAAADEPAIEVDTAHDRAS